ncbi:hypothetical protein MMUR_53570 [Mycolicibacterium murale]|uniref:Uncharacterized protein n=1 Tax=Mycolicibacterium murale TaxID=182220 RepID=A0A7I9WTZ4_9MYCO|nr:hypothetical protein [Mycolicibacterium murale]MCV7181333.1 hypothetical protein [Mycolicibacterium murale]GFG61221.1 hypothetical protein MMUR_53570 [Mycolicibacterium murale]
MVNRGGKDDGSIADVPWAAVFDPDNNMRAIGEIQARGFRAATEVVDRLLRSAKRPPADGAHPDDAGRHGGAAEADRVLEMGHQVIGQLARSVREVLAPQGNVAGVDLAQARGAGVITIVCPADTATAAAEVWLHNTGSVDLGTVRLRCSDLWSHDGSVIDSAAVRFEPDAVPMPGRSSRGVTIEVEVPGPLPAGHYRGTLLADGYPDAWLQVEVAVAR